MRSIFIILLLVFIFAVNANAVLTDNLDGTVTQTRNDGSVLMWVQNEPQTALDCYVNNADFSSNWFDAAACINYFNTINYLGYNDWRFPNALPVNGVSYNFTISDDGSTDIGSNITSPNSEISYLYYVELGNTAGGGWSNTGPFITGLGGGSWYGTEDPRDSSKVFILNGGGYQNVSSKDIPLMKMWAVRDITVVPEPISSVLFAAGGTLLAGRLYVKRNK